jgi:hypothetical protein
VVWSYDGPDERLKHVANLTRCSVVCWLYICVSYLINELSFYYEVCKPFKSFRGKVFAVQFESNGSQTTSLSNSSSSLHTRACTNVHIRKTLSPISSLCTDWSEVKWHGDLTSYNRLRNVDYYSGDKATETFSPSFDVVFELRYSYVSPDSGVLDCDTLRS